MISCIVCGRLVPEPTVEECPTCGNWRPDMVCPTCREYWAETGTVARPPATYHPTSNQRRATERRHEASRKSRAQGHKDG